MQPFSFKKQQCVVFHEKAGFCYCRASIKYLYNNYPKSQNYCFTRCMNQIISGAKSRESIRFVDDLCFLERTNLLKRYYEHKEYAGKIKTLAEYYKFHEDVPRICMEPMSSTVHLYYDFKRRLTYLKVTRMLEQQRQAEAEANQSVNDDQTRVKKKKTRKNQNVQEKNETIDEPSKEMILIEEQHDVLDFDADIENFGVRRQKKIYLNRSLKKVLPESLIHSLMNWKPKQDHSLSASNSTPSHSCERESSSSRELLQQLMNGKAHAAANPRPVLKSDRNRTRNRISAMNHAKFYFGAQKSDFYIRDFFGTESFSCSQIYGAARSANDKNTLPYNNGVGYNEKSIDTLMDLNSILKEGRDDHSLLNSKMSFLNSENPESHGKIKNYKRAKNFGHFHPTQETLKNQNFQKVPSTERSSEKHPKIASKWVEITEKNPQNYLQKDPKITQFAQKNPKKRLPKDKTPFLTRESNPAIRSSQKKFQSIKRKGTQSHQKSKKLGHNQIKKTRAGGGDSFYSQLKDKDIQRLLGTQNSGKSDLEKSRALGQIILDKMKNKKILRQFQGCSKKSVKDKNLFKKKFNLCLGGGKSGQSLRRKNSLGYVKSGNKAGKEKSSSKVLKEAQRQPSKRRKTKRANSEALPHPKFKTKKPDDSTHSRNPQQPLITLSQVPHSTNPISKRYSPLDLNFNPNQDFFDPKKSHRNHSKKEIFQKEIFQNQIFQKKISGQSQSKKSLKNKNREIHRKKKSKSKNKSLGNLKKIRMLSSNTQIHNTLSRNPSMQHNLQIKASALNFKTQGSNVYKQIPSLNIYDDKAAKSGHYDGFLQERGSIRQSNLHNPGGFSTHLYQDAGFDKKNFERQMFERKRGAGQFLTRDSQKNLNLNQNYKNNAKSNNFNHQNILFRDRVANHVNLKKKKRSLKLFEDLGLEFPSEAQLNSAEMRFKSSKKKISKDALNFNLKRRSNGSLWKSRKIEISPEVKKPQKPKNKRKSRSKKKFLKESAKARALESKKSSKPRAPDYKESKLRASRVSHQNALSRTRNGSTSTRRRIKKINQLELNHSRCKLLAPDPLRTGDRTNKTSSKIAFQENILERKSMNSRSQKVILIVPSRSGAKSRDRVAKKRKDSRPRADFLELAKKLKIKKENRKSLNKQMRVSDGHFLRSGIENNLFQSELNPLGSSKNNDLARIKILNPKNADFEKKPKPKARSLKKLKKEKPARNFIDKPNKSQNRRRKPQIKLRTRPRDSSGSRVLALDQLILTGNKNSAISSEAFVKNSVSSAKKTRKSNNRLRKRDLDQRILEQFKRVNFQSMSKHKKKGSKKELASPFTEKATRTEFRSKNSRLKSLVGPFWEPLEGSRVGSKVQLKPKSSNKKKSKKTKLFGKINLGVLSKKKGKSKKQSLVKLFANGTMSTRPDSINKLHNSRSLRRVAKKRF